jgi:hypothetical protein
VVSTKVHVAHRCDGEQHAPSQRDFELWRWGTRAAGGDAERPRFCGLCTHVGDDGRQIRAP